MIELLSLFIYLFIYKFRQEAWITHRASSTTRSRRQPEMIRTIGELKRKKFPLQNRSQLEFKTTDWILNFQVLIPSLLKKQWNIEYREEHYSAARRYEFYFFEWWKQYFKNERSEWVKYRFTPRENKIYIFNSQCNFHFFIASTKKTLPNWVVGYCVCSWVACACSKRQKSWKEVVGRFQICAIFKRHNSIQHAERAMRHFETSKAQGSIHHSWSLATPDVQTAYSIILLLAQILKMKLLNQMKRVVLCTKEVKRVILLNKK